MVWLSNTLEYLRRRRDLFRRLALSDRVNVVMLALTMISLGIALYAARMSVVAMNHADDGGKQTIDELKKQQSELEKERVELQNQRALLDKSSQTLDGVLDQIKTEVANGQKTVAQLQGQLKLNQQQTALSTEQVQLAQQQLAEMEKFYEKAPSLEVSVACRVRWPHGGPPNSDFDSFTVEPADFTHQGVSRNIHFMQAQSGTLDCHLTLRNTGTDSAKNVEVDADFKNIFHLDWGVRLPSEALYRNMTIATDKQTTNDNSSLIKINSWDTVAPSSISDNVYEANFKISATDPMIKSYTLELMIRSENTRLPAKFLIVRIHWPGPREDYWKGR